MAAEMVVHFFQMKTGVKLTSVVEQLQQLNMNTK